MNRHQFTEHLILTIDFQSIIKLITRINSKIFNLIQIISIFLLHLCPVPSRKSGLKTDKISQQNK